MGFFEVFRIFWGVYEDFLSGQPLGSMSGECVTLIVAFVNECDKFNYIRGRLIKASASEGHIKEERAECAGPGGRVSH